MPNILRLLLEGSYSEDSTSKLIMNAEDYAQKVLLQGKTIPWHDATAYANHLSQIATLLRPHVAVISLDKMIAQELSENQKLTTAMSEKSRAGYALRTFMSDEEFRAAASALVASSVQTQRIPVVMQLPSPLQMLYSTTRAVQPDLDYDFDDDDAENAAIYCADWLRTFNGTQIAGLIFDEREGEVAEEAYQPIKNIAEHYQWVIGVRRDNEVLFSSPKITIPVLPSMYWTSGEVTIKTSGAIFTEIARDAVPEQVLDFREKLS
ncbi:hypothetical protein Psyc_1447 [Psychrobacter arcticus 273-4]|uniref:Uncharacterized protein n=1 Tax=Psychrobacter arcticus (strain DSM 17307 / VKM B-2377 / 273-4) TaxID=259536 RepID=Q4FRR3_PSYA2|nr:hypothetical protein [Psychrobacter arcticus]AAZ19295.1 hypothetical protein Psyc_1447 [Psychrobacter arcticus 273-4]